MSKNYVIGFPRIGEKRELKRALESFWSKKIDSVELERVAKELRERHIKYQKKAGVEFISVNDFSLYDNMLDTALMINAIPDRFKNISDKTELYFSMARGADKIAAMEMTKWFNTNYHYIVPELSKKDEYKADIFKIEKEYEEAKKLGVKPKINLIGPITFTALSKRVDGEDVFEFFGKVLEVYKEVLSLISKLDDDVLIQMEEPIFVTDLEPKVLSLIKFTYDSLCKVDENIKIAVITYFEHANEAVRILADTPVWGVGLDFVYGEENLKSLDVLKDSDKVLIAGVVDGRNVWRNDIQKSVELLKDISKKIPKDRIIPSTSCSLLHTPFTLKYEEKLREDIKSWLSFSLEKLDELNLISKLFFEESLSEDEEKLYEESKKALSSKANSSFVHNKEVKKRVESIKSYDRELPYEERIKIQHKELKYPILPTTTIGSFPQTDEIRKVRRDYKNGFITEEKYEEAIKRYIDDAIAFQEEIDLDILVHGEPERNDMVEYFGQMLNGFAFTENGWVQSYGSRCVKPPLIYGDVSRDEPMTVKWITYAQSKTKKIVKGMLTGPVTIINWSFVRDDKNKSEIAKEIALCIKDEIEDLQNSGIKIVQVDEAAFKEGYPLRKSKIKEYEEWALNSFRLSVSSAKASTQIHTHMCYSEFNDIIKTIEAMDADVISIETARSGNVLLRVFKEVGYTHEIGPGVYDIHSPAIPTVEEMEDRIKAFFEVLPKTQLWVNPDCGLKTRKWQEVKPSLRNMVKAAKRLRESS
ncbi:MAG: 5-methyltetrahydropteroyltriglutamate--homocysteine S-methyltransferase [Epsilonproteobacteria bacterium]|nr:5-methyltetrahydropteroyltriglutamate--homocysteine S-methyltransferase [Campylobacterota bacterium]